MNREWKKEAFSLREVNFMKSLCMTMLRTPHSHKKIQRRNFIDLKESILFGSSVSVETSSSVESRDQN